MSARTTARESTGLLQDKALKHPARPAARASTGRLQDQPLKHPARHAVRASTGRKQEDPVKHRARLVPRTRSRLLRALHKPPAFVMQATFHPMALRARRVRQIQFQIQSSGCVSNVSQESTKWG